MMQQRRWIAELFPLVNRLKIYTWRDTYGDLVAGTISAVMVVPQAMAYSHLAGLPPEMGLYACILPLVVYGLLGSSGALSVGPVALLSLLVIAEIGLIALPGSPEYLELCVTLAALTGVLQIGMSLLRLGFLVNFISHPVLIGFTSAAAVLIGCSQLKQLLGISVDSAQAQWRWLLELWQEIPNAHLLTSAMGGVSIVVLVLTSGPMALFLRRRQLSEKWLRLGQQLMPLVVVVVGTILTASFDWSERRGVDVVGVVPAGLPRVTIPNMTLEYWQKLLPTAFVVAMVGYVQSISVAQTFASRRRERVDPNRELFALGMADLAAAFTGGYPVTGSLSVSSVKETSGARTAVSSLICAAWVLIAVVFLTRWMYYVPQTILAAVVIVSVASLFNLWHARQLWQYSRGDAAALVVTFVAVLWLGVQVGILWGMAANIGLWMWRTSRPRIVEVGRIPGTEIFRNIERHQVELTEGLLSIRVDESLYFANARYLNNFVLRKLSDRPRVHTVLLIASGINQMDATGMEMLKSLINELGDIRVRLLMSDIKGHVLDRMSAAGFEAGFLTTHVFLSADLAVKSVAAQPVGATWKNSSLEIDQAVE